MSDGVYTEGQKYRVTCVRASYPHRSPVRWWPIMGEVHEDGDHLNFPFHHFHVDFRFVAPTDIPRLEVIEFGQKIKLDDPDIAATLGRPIHIQSIVPYPSKDLPHPLLIPRPTVCELPDGPERNWKQDKLRTYYRPYFKWDDIFRHGRYEGEVVFRDLSNAFRNTKLVGPNGRVCPHRGYDLSEVEPDEQGVIQCPLHALRWCAKTGENVYP